MITLLTDFGNEDAFVGVMKGVMLAIASNRRVVDLTHEVAPQDLTAAAFHLASAAPYFPEGTVHLVVVDPGVGTERRAIAVRTKRAFYVAPDNGVLTLALRDDPPRRIVAVENPKYRLPTVSATFHGRDVFAPTAAHLANGVEMTELGPEISDIAYLDIPSAETQANGVVSGRVMHIDRFGNAITNIPNSALFEQSSWNIVFSGGELGGIRTAYGAVSPGEGVAVWGSSGYLEIAVRDGSAAIEFGMSNDDEVNAVPA